MNRIKAARKAAGMSQKYVAMTLGVKGPSVSNWESGKTMPTPDNLSALAKLFGVTVDYLLGRDTTQALVVDVSGSMKQGKSETAAIIESILAKLAQLDEEGQKEADTFIDFILAKQNGGE